MGGMVAVIGGPQVYSLFLRLGYDVFHLWRVADVDLPGGLRLFLCERFDGEPDACLAAAGLTPGKTVARRRRDADGLALERSATKSSRVGTPPPLWGREGRGSRPSIPIGCFTDFVPGRNRSHTRRKQRDPRPCPAPLVGTRGAGTRRARNRLAPSPARSSRRGRPF